MNSDAYSSEQPLIRRLLCVKVLRNRAGLWTAISNHMKIGVSKPVLTNVTSPVLISTWKAWSKFKIEQLHKKAFKTPHFSVHNKGENYLQSLNCVRWDTMHIGAVLSVHYE